MHLAAITGKATLCRHLLRKHGADDSALTLSGQRPVDVAANLATKRVFFEAHLERLFECAQTDNDKLVPPIVALLRANGMLEPAMPTMLLHVAAEHGAMRVMELLLGEPFKVGVNAATALGRTALHYAVGANQYGAIRLLLAKGASTDALDTKGRRPIDESADRMTRRVIEQAAAQHSSKALAGELKSTLDYFQSSSHVVEALFTVAFHDLSSADEGLVRPVPPQPKPPPPPPSPQQQQQGPAALQPFVVPRLDRHESVFLPEEQAGANTTTNGAPAASGLRPRLVAQRLGPALIGRPLTLERYGVFCKEALVSCMAEHRRMAELDDLRNKLDLTARRDKGLGAETLALRRRRRGLLESPGSGAGSPGSPSPGQWQGDDVGEFYVRSSALRPRFYTFVVTDTEGARSFLSMIVFLELTARDEAGFAHLEGRCVCLLSHMPLLSLHRAILLDLFAVGKGCWRHVGALGGLEVSTMVSSVLELEAKNVEEAGLAVDLGTRWLALAMPPPLSLPFVEDACFEALFLLLRPQHVVTALSALLTEQSVLLISEHVHLLTLVSQALLALIFPFEWHHPYIPILPRDMLLVVEAPFPFLIGIRSQYLDAVSADRLVSVLIVNLDRDSVVAPIEPAARGSAGGSGPDGDAGPGKASSGSSAGSSLIFSSPRSPRRDKTDPSNEAPQLPAGQRAMIESAIHAALPRMRRAPVERLAVALMMGNSHVEVDRAQLPEQPPPITTQQAAATPVAPGGPEAGRAKAERKTSLTGIFNKVLASYSSRESGFREATVASSESVLTEGGVAGVRVACVRALATLIGGFGKSRFDKAHLNAFIQNHVSGPSKLFVQALLATQLWASFQRDVESGGRTEQRDWHLQLFTRTMDNEMGHPVLLVKDVGVLLTRNPAVNSPIVTTLRRGDRCTVIDTVTVSDSHGTMRWMSFREYRGWYMDDEHLRRGKDDSAFETELRPWNLAKFHVSSGEIYPVIAHAVGADKIAQAIQLVPAAAHSPFPSLADKQYSGTSSTSVRN